MKTWKVWIAAASLAAGGTVAGEPLTITWSAQNPGSGLASADGQELAPGSLVRLGYFRDRLETIPGRFHDLPYLEERFVEVSREQIYQQGWQCLVDEWEFNRRAGWKDEDNDMPDCMKEDKIGPQEVVYDVPVELANQAKKQLPYEEDMFTTKATG